MLNDIDRSTRVINILSRAGIADIDTLCNLTRVELSMLRGMKSEDLAYIEVAIHAVGRHLAEKGNGSLERLRKPQQENTPKVSMMMLCLAIWLTTEENAKYVTDLANESGISRDYLWEKTVAVAMRQGSMPDMKQMDTLMRAILPECAKIIQEDEALDDMFFGG